ncbi:hypothetical protein NBRC110019_03690 [Neptunitalea chrysea]|uniref:Outer membrane efflux protein n=1 Tax=Neptunitalea chrysea TaxID=1647581 RepID=A0A9W6B4A1_9FLAO|nr:TolC family protein [Neptunitalea chrysea]GLB51330.1 hypothetical protein NBRC110019_03690 [Neptunitalea chrysea]
MIKINTINKFLTLLIFPFVLFSYKTAHSQDVEYFITKSLEETDFSKKLPPLDTLKAWTRKNSPLLKYDQANIEYYKVNVRLARAEWLKYIYLEGVYNYGMYGYLSSEQLTGVAQANESLINTETSRYTVGMSLKIPLAAFFNRKKNVHAEKTLQERAQYQKQVSMIEIERKLILDYNDVLRAHRLMLVSNTIIDTYKVQSMRAESDYENGLIPLSEYTRLQQQMNDAFKEFEKNRAEFLLAFMYLENTVGVEIKLNNNLIEQE